jgi:UDP-N-acetylmuramyl tripeptide synthase
LHNTLVIQRTAAVAAAKATAAVSRRFRLGGGTALPGLVAERIDPDVIRDLAAELGQGSVIVTGTNGKTTTARLLRSIAKAAGLKPVANRAGSNMMRGIAAALVDVAGWSGDIASPEQRLGIFEVDEATLPHVANAVRPRAVLFTNLFRDQLDRYGEVDNVAASWERAIGIVQQTALQGESATNSKQQTTTTLVLNADDPAVAHLGRAAQGPVIYYGVEDATAGGQEGDHASDFRTCLDCSSELSYSVTFYGHIGHWRCPSCGNARPQPGVLIERVTPGDDASTLDVSLPGEEPLHVTLPMSGLYNAYNALAAIAGATALGLPRDAIIRALEGFSAAFGRQERFSIDGRDVRVLLGKNPTGLNQVLRAIAERSGDKRILFFLNDGIADGRDVSWIWDADYETVRPRCVWTMAAGTRAEDLALRLKYGGFGADVPVERATHAALRRALEATPAGATLHVVPTYTAMLEVRELLARQGGAKKFWEDA